MDRPKKIIWPKLFADCPSKRNVVNPVYGSPRNEFLEGKCGACIGLFQKIIAGKEPKEAFVECIIVLKNTDSEEADHIVEVMTNWAHENNLLPTTA